METFDKLQDWILEQRNAGIDDEKIMDALEQALDLMREEQKE